MYISRAVQGLRDDPDPAADIRVLVETAGDHPQDDVRATIEAISGTLIQEELSFETMIVRTPQTQLGALCKVRGITAIETVDILGLDVGDAGEDVEFEV